MQCNIDARGKRVRLINGIVMLAASIVLAFFWAYPFHSTVPWIITAILFASGVFSIYEARAGWCALRAMGIKTRV